MQNNRLGLFVLLTAIASMMMPHAAQAVPAFATQTGQPCSACHVGAFGPQLKQTGRDFKMYGYINQDEKDHFPPVAMTSQTSFTHTKADQAGGAAPGFKDNNNVAEDQISIYYAGRITPTVGAFIQTTYDGVAHEFSWDNMDIRHAVDVNDDLVAGLTINNGPTMEDIWNSTPIWGFPYNNSPLAPTPAAATLVDGALRASSVMGVGGYTMWKNWIYTELAGYGNIPGTVQRDLGNQGVSLADSYSGGIPYGRLALQHAFGNTYFELGGYGLHADRFPGGITASGTDKITDLAVDESAQYYTENENHFVSQHATLITERMRLDADSALNGTNARDDLRTFRTDVSYSYKDTYTPTVQFFKSWGTADPALYPTSATGKPNSQGYVTEIAFVPWGKAVSPAFDWFNGRLALQYTGYTQFDGSTHGAANNNTIYLSLWFALDPFNPLSKH